MTKSFFVLAIIFTLTLFVPAQENTNVVSGEKHLKNIKQLTFGGENAEAYFSTDGKQLIFQSNFNEPASTEIYTMNSDGSNVKMVSNSRAARQGIYFKVGKRY